jgi:N-acetyl-anhydromuramyl-L-alanine amidase AmpD
VNHISEGSALSCINWFKNENNIDSSSHFLIAKDGTIHQFVKIEDNAWANGTINNPSSKIQKSMPNINPNWYSISIEHEGIFSETNGVLTGEQIKSNIMLTEYIKEYIEDVYNYDFEIDSDHIFGHCMLDSVNRPNCPGKLFPYLGIIKGISDFEVSNPPHWALDSWKKLNEKGIKINEQHFDDNITRGELFSLLNQIVK